MTANKKMVYSTPEWREKRLRNIAALETDRSGVLVFHEDVRWVMAELDRSKDLLAEWMSAEARPGSERGATIAGLITKTSEVLGWDK